MSDTVRLMVYRPFGPSAFVDVLGKRWLDDAQQLACSLRPGVTIKAYVERQPIAEDWTYQTTGEEDWRNEE